MLHKGDLKGNKREHSLLGDIEVTRYCIDAFVELGPWDLPCSHTYRNKCKSRDNEPTLIAVCSFVEPLQMRLHTFDGKSQRALGPPPLVPVC